jgi:hypothetical protein
MRFRSPYTRTTTIGCVMLAMCIFAAACGRGTADSPTSPTSAAGGFDQTQARGGEQLPFRGSLEGLETDVVAPPSLLADGTATGTGTHLGRYTAVFTATVTLATDASTGTISFTAANGDRLDAVFVGHGTPTSEPNLHSLVEVATINGGTGRFAGATGAFTIRRLIDLGTGASSGSFEGTINPGR